MSGTTISMEKLSSFPHCCVCGEKSNLIFPFIYTPVNFRQILGTPQNYEVPLPMCKKCKIKFKRRELLPWIPFAPVLIFIFINTVIGLPQSIPDPLRKKVVVGLLGLFIVSIIILIAVTKYRPFVITKILEESSLKIYFRSDKVEAAFQEYVKSLADTSEENIAKNIPEKKTPLFSFSKNSLLAILIILPIYMGLGYIFIGANPHFMPLAKEFLGSNSSIVLLILYICVLLWIDLAVTLIHLIWFVAIWLVGLVVIVQVISVMDESWKKRKKS